MSPTDAAPLVPTLADAPLAAYLLAEPFVAGKVVLDVGPRPARAAERLSRAGAKQVLTMEGPGPRMELSDGAVDVVICAVRLSGAANDVERHRWLSEIRRVLRSGGFALVRIPAVSGSGRGAEARAGLLEMLRPHFATVDLVPEAPISALSYIAPGTDDVAVNEELATFAQDPSHFIALCAESQRSWHIPESLIVPLRGEGAEKVLAGAQEVAALREELESMGLRHEAVCRERDALRDTAMTLQDQTDRNEDALSGLRREAERHLRQLSDDASALELTTLEKDRLEKRAASAERALESLGAQLQQRTAELTALQREVARLRGEKVAR
ncbi:MAG TPA: methyltransferase domain-containing protein [Polyangia bacterium]|nr:methyltransferase domain-containing protein [Polyangia bacterium]